ncbi:MAG TPA: SDR family NAD(P)-dependent oxidoreductase [Acidimicrobiales bacterium]|jgi:NAD(P)-dependent dehydrogenase (short-subunit alcohol dehydrogenase family)|nr:SDR family NAD(P)-dependent oxidoreductase [Acidimicrobiales bacterium]
MSAPGRDAPLGGRVAVVTGAGRGIGRTEALRLAANGASVLVNDTGVATDGSPTTETPAQEVVAEIVAGGGTAMADGHDISTHAGARAAVVGAIEQWGRIDIVVNNAGIGRPHMVFNLGDDEWDDVIRVHLTGTFAVSRAACQWWRAEAKAGRGEGGRLINTATGLLLYGGAGQSNYVAAKAGALAFTEALAIEMAPYGVTANAVMPSAQTRLAAVGWRMTELREAEDSYDPTDPVHVAEMVCYLAGPDAGWITGQCFQVRGGLIDHVGTWTVSGQLERTDGGWTAAELALEMPRLFGAGSKRPMLPPKEWQEQYRARGTSATAPGPEEPVGR